MEDNAKVVAVLGRNRRFGRWRVASHTLVVAVFGTCELDLTRALAEAEEDEDVSFSIFAFFGNVTVHLRRGTDVQPSGIAIASSTMVNMDQDNLRHDKVPVSIEWTTLFSRLRVTEDEAPVPTRASSVDVPTPTLAAQPRPAESERDEPDERAPEEASLQDA